MALFYTDASALVKLVREEPESAALRVFLAGADVVSCELVLAEVPRAVRRAVLHDPGLPLGELLSRTGDLLEALGLIALDSALLVAAGAVDEPVLRTLDAIHLCAAISVLPLDGFISYDERQSAAARLAGLRTFVPGR